MNNPINMIRKEKGLTWAQFSMLAGVSTQTLHRIESGNLKVITPAVLDTVEKWGYDRHQIESDYQTWKIKRVNELRKQLEV